MEDVGSSVAISSVEQDVFGDICQEIGWFQVLSEENAHEFAKLASYHYTLLKNRAYLDEFVDGLHSLGVVNLIQEHSGMCNNYYFNIVFI